MLRMIFCAFCITVTLLGAATASVDDLLSARCQSRCLYDLEQRFKENAELRRQLKHQTVNLCKEDAKCASCLSPCREASTPTTSVSIVVDNATCISAICQDAVDPDACRQSCTFLMESHRKRPGSCPRSIPVSLNECSAACDRDGDCPGAEKCCASGCSRVCAAPTVSDRRLLPIPEGLTIQERKRKRSAVVRWVMKRLNKGHMTTNSNLYVIQWRWGVKKDVDAMTPWQTIMVKNKMYAILKHLLMPGRYYVFRVAAVNQFGTAGFSQPSPVFKLSKEVKAPAAPKNLTLESIVFDESAGRWVPKLAWVPPASDLPIKDYQLSWWRSTADFANAYEQRSGRQIPEAVSAAMHAADPEDEEDYDEPIARSSSVVPSYATKTQVTDGLESDRVYMIELFATVESSEGELRGEPAVLFIRTSNPSEMLNDAESVRYEVDSSGASVPSDSTTEIPDAGVNLPTSNPNPNPPTNQERDSLVIKSPFIEHGKLRTVISWIDSPSCSSQSKAFYVKLIPEHCSTGTETRMVTVTQCVAPLDDLSFDCDYRIKLEVPGEPPVLVASAVFSTLPCESTPSLEAVSCRPGDASSRPSCYLTSPTAAACEWSAPTSTSIIGYRTILSSPHFSARIGVASVHVPRMAYDNLTPGTDYRFRLQPVTNSGLGSPIDVEFSTPFSDVPVFGSPELDLSSEFSPKFGKYPVLELPLGSGSPTLAMPSLRVLLVILSTGAWLLR